MTTSHKIILVDDDRELCELLCRYLSAEGFAVSAVYCGQDILDLLRSGESVDALVLDIMMPGLSGLEVLQQLRQFSEIPVLMLTGRGDDIDRIIGLEMGADDYLAKPCNPRELSARLKAILRRAKQSLTAVTETVMVRGIELDCATLQARVKGQLISFTAAEFNLLHLLMASAGQVLSKQLLTEQVLHRKLSAYDRSIDVHVSRIRQKLASQGGLANVIKSVRGVGYQLVGNDDL